MVKNSLRFWMRSRSWLSSPTRMTTSNTKSSRSNCSSPFTPTSGNGRSISNPPIRTDTPRSSQTVSVWAVSRRRTGFSCGRVPTFPAQKNRCSHGIWWPDGQHNSLTKRNTSFRRTSASSPLRRASRCPFLISRLLAALLHPRASRSVLSFHVRRFLSRSLTRRCALEPTIRTAASSFVPISKRINLWRTTPGS